MKQWGQILIFTLCTIVLLSNCQMGGKKEERRYRDDDHYSTDLRDYSDQEKNENSKDQNDSSNYDRKNKWRDRDDSNSKQSSANLSLRMTSIPQGATIDIHEYFSVSVRYRINNFSSKFRYRLYLVGRNTRGSDTLFMATKYIKNSSGNADLLVKIRRNHLRGFGEEGNTMRMFVKLDAIPKGSWRGNTLARISLRYRRGLDTPVRTIREKPRYNKTVILNGKRITLQRGKLILWHANGKLKHGYLLRPATFTRGGIRVTAGRGKANFTKDGKLKATWNLQRDTMLKAGGRHLLFKKGSSISFYPNGNISVGDIARSYKFTIGDREYTFRRGARVGFFMDNSVRIVKTVSRQKVKIGRKEFRLPGWTLFFFTQSGRVDNLVGSRVLTFNIGTKKIYCAPGTAIKFTKLGELTGCRLARNTRFTLSSGAIIAKRMSEILFYKSGAPLSVNLKRNTWLTVAGKKILFKAQRFNMRFHKNGTVWIAYPARNFVYPVAGGRASIKAGKQIAFNKKGKLLWGSLLRPLQLNSRIGTLRIRTGRTTHFHKNGQIKMGYLAENAYVTVNGTSYLFQGGKYISFHSNGMPSRATLGETKTMRIRWRGRMRTVRMRRGMTVWFDRYGQAKR